MRALREVDIVAALASSPIVSLNTCARGWFLYKKSINQLFIDEMRDTAKKNVLHSSKPLMSVLLPLCYHY